MAYNAYKIEISVTEHDILDHLKVLRKIDSQGQDKFYQENYVRNSIRRYETCWLPLITTLSDNFEDDLKFAPPLDVQWVWQVHMLAPCLYKSDLERLFGRRVNFQTNIENIQSLRSKTQQCWSQEFPSEPFDHPKEVIATDYVSRMDYNIAEAIQRQKSFFYQVSLPHYKSKSFLQKCIQRYKMYLYLKSKNPNTFLVPCYDMDIVWHTHQCHPILYGQETVALLGHILPHDDSVNERSKGSKLVNAEGQTRTLWKETFGKDGKDFAQPGAMFRGEPPNGKLLMIDNEVQMNILKGSHYTVKLKDVHWIAHDQVQVEKYGNNAKLNVRLYQWPLKLGGWEKQCHDLPLMKAKSINGTKLYFETCIEEVTYEDNSRLALGT